MTINVITIFVAAIQQWSFGTIIWIYWAQSVIIGIFAFLRMIRLKEFSTKGLTSNSQPIPETKVSKYYVALFFLVHYGGFHLIYLAFIWQHTIEDVRIFLIVVTLFFVNHMFSSIYNEKKDATSKPNIGNLMFDPYGRIIPIHLIILVASTLTGTISLIIFMTIKLFVDIITHLIKHNPKLIKDKLNDI